MRRLVMLLLLAAMLLLAVAPVAATPPSKRVRGKVCVVNDLGGGDSWVNRSVAEGVKRAWGKHRVEAVTLDATNEAEIQSNIDAFVTAGDCDLIMGVGFTVGFEMEPFILDPDNLDQLFAVIGFPIFWEPNAAGVWFRPDEAAFLAGYIAAGVSETGKVGVYGGAPIPPVTDYMNGYALGVEYYNAQYGTSVEVLGWDPHTQDGLFSDWVFDDPEGWGRSLGGYLMNEGADSVFPVAGRTGLGTMWEAQDRRDAGQPYARVIGVDYDWYAEHREYDRVLLTSVVKGFGQAAFDQIAALMDGTWAPELVFEDLASGGVDIAPFHHLNNVVPGHLKNDLKAIREGIIGGSIPTQP
jgi:basic membrane protein A